MGMGYNSIEMEENILEIGKMIRRVDMGRKDGPMDPDTEACLRMELNTAKDTLSGLMEVTSKENSKRARFMVLEHIIGAMDELTRGNGLITQCMVKVALPGLTVENTPDHI